MDIEMTTRNGVTIHLQEIAKRPDFPSDSEAIVDSWISGGMGFEAVNHVLRFMEGNPDIDYGKPGALVYFLERFYLHGYEDQLIASIRRKPTPHTVWMLNRLINGAKSSGIRSHYIDELRNAKAAHQLDGVTLAAIDHFLNRI